MYDSLQTIKHCHDLMKTIKSHTKREKFTAALMTLFDKKQVSEDGEYDNFKLTKEDVDNVYQGL